MRSTPTAQQLPSMADSSSSSKRSPAFKGTNPILINDYNFHFLMGKAHCRHFSDLFLLLSPRSSATPNSSRPPSCPPMHNNSKGDGMVIIRDEQFASFYLPSPTCQSWGIASHGILLGDPLPLSLQSDNFHHHASVADVDTSVVDILQLMNSPSPSLSFSSSYPSSTATAPSSEGSMNVLRSILRGHSSSSNGITTITSSSSSTTHSLMSTGGTSSSGGASTAATHTPLQRQGLAQGQGLKGCVDTSTRASPGTSPCTSTGSDSCDPTEHGRGIGNTAG